MTYKSKLCPCCDTEFQPTAGVQKRCPSCRIQYEKEYHKERWRRYYATEEQRHDSWARHIAKKYKMTVVEYEDRWTSQEGRCLLCSRPEKAKARLCVDHSHKTGEVRGLLCRRCNSMLGWAERIGLDGVLRYLGGI